MHINLLTARKHTNLGGCKEVQNIIDSGCKEVQNLSDFVIFFSLVNCSQIPIKDFPHRNRSWLATKNIFFHHR